MNAYVNRINVYQLLVISQLSIIYPNLGVFMIKTHYMF